MKGRIALAAAVLIILALLYNNTGFLQASAMDQRDLARWNFTNGVITGAEGYTLDGNSGQCWVMVHGYTSTPDELRIVAAAIHDAFNDTVYVPRLDGHGMRSSDLLEYSVSHWYKQVEETANLNHCQFLLGSSMGASLILRYAETHNVKGVVAVGTPLILQPHYLPTGAIASAIAPLVTYTKRAELGETIDNKSARIQHITGYSFPLGPVGQLDDFNVAVRRDLSSINASVLFLHAENDTVAFIDGATSAFDTIKSPKKFVELQGNHVVFRDYDKEKAVDEVKRFRGTFKVD